MKKRYGIILEEEVYRNIRTHAYAAGQTVGEFIEAGLTKRLAAPVWNVTDLGLVRTIDLGPNITKEQFAAFKLESEEILAEEPMEQDVKKAIEPDKVQPTDKGKLTKGLGDIPGVSRQQRTDEILRKINKEKK